MLQLYARTYMFSKASIVKKYAKEITLLFSMSLFHFWHLFYLIAFNDVFGFVMTVAVFLMLIKRPKDRLFFLTMYMVVAVLEIGGTAYSAWSWPDTAFGVFPFWIAK